MTTIRRLFAMFDPGFLRITPAASMQLHEEDVFSCLVRHMGCDWGDVDEQDWKTNDHAVMHGFRILSSYKDRKGVSFWIITEADRSATTILLPNDY